MTAAMRPADGGENWRQGVQMSCPACGKVADALGNTRPGPIRKPESGDFSICFGCGEVSVVQVSPIGVAQLVEATVEQLAEFAAVPENTEAVRRLHRFNAAGGHGDLP